MFDSFFTIFMDGLNEYIPLKTVHKHSNKNDNNKLKKYISELRNMREKLVFFSDLKLPGLQPFIKKYKSM